jgi:tripartite-type tricarboxylate transporter receptor subunit TctC
MLLSTACRAAAPSGAQQTDRAQSGAVSVESFFAGKTITMIVGLAPGGGFDTYTRLIARHLGKHVPGNPNVVVENMVGAGSLVATNHVFNVAPKDGTVIGAFHGNMLLLQLLGGEGVQFEATKFEFLGGPGPDNILCVVSERSGLKTLGEVQTPGGRQLILGGTAPGASTDDVAAVMAEALNVNVRIVRGYGGTSEIRLAMEQGEVDGMCGWSWESARTSNSDDFATGRIIPVVQFTDAPIADMPVAGVPLARDLAANDEARQLLQAGVQAPSRTIRPYALPPGTPKERVDALREAFTATFKDPAFLEEARSAKLALNPMTGEEFTGVVRELFAVPEPMKARLKKIILPAG